MKPALIILALVGVLFFAVLVSSRSNAAVQAPKDREGRASLANTYRPPGMVSLVGAALGRWSPKVKFAQTAYTVVGQPIKVFVPASDDKFRRARIRVAPPNCEDMTAGCQTAEGKQACISYEATDGEGADQDLASQKWRGTESEPCVGSFVVRPKGGTMTLACPPLQTCSITLE